MPVWLLCDYNAERPNTNLTAIVNYGLVRSEIHMAIRKLYPPRHSMFKL